MLKIVSIWHMIKVLINCASVSFIPFCVTNLRHSPNGSGVDTLGCRYIFTTEIVPLKLVPPLFSSFYTSLFHDHIDLYNCSFVLIKRNSWTFAEKPQIKE